MKERFYKFLVDEGVLMAFLSQSKSSIDQIVIKLEHKGELMEIISQPNDSIDQLAVKLEHKKSFAPKWFLRDSTVTFLWKTSKEGWEFWNALDDKWEQICEENGYT